MKAIIFDLDDTLVMEQGTVKEVFLETCKLASEQYNVLPEQLTETIYKSCRNLWFNSPLHPYCKMIGISSWEGLWCQFAGDKETIVKLREWSPTYRFESWNTALLNHDINDRNLAQELADRFMNSRRRFHRLFDETLPVLENLKGKYCLGMLTTGASDLQREKIVGAGVRDYFDSIVVSGDYEIGKPDKRIFEITLSKLGVEPHEAVMVGDSLRSDIQGAISAGIRNVWVNRTGKTNDWPFTPDDEIKSLTELEKLLG